MFGLKCASLLKYDEQRKKQAFQNNLKSLLCFQKGEVIHKWEIVLRQKFQNSYVQHLKQFIRNYNFNGGYENLPLFQYYLILTVLAW